MSREAAPDGRFAQRPHGSVITPVAGSLAAKITPRTAVDAAAPRRTIGHQPADRPARLTRDEPDVQRVAFAFSRAIVEVLRGYRPAAQLARWTCPTLQDDLERRAPRRPIGPRLQITRIRIGTPADGAAEVCALAFDPTSRRVRVHAFRLEQRSGSGWTVTRLQAG
jgi:hypothetical protein